jgi:3-deoxy-manno-octulosonate cytidylyltransferase (CMP-KDO synthetase)
MSSRVMCVVDQQGYAMYFSRGMLPNNKSGVPDVSHEYELHLGLQCYTAKFLSVYSKLPPTPCQLQEDLEQLKILEHGYNIKVVRVSHSAHCVDESEDVASIEAIIKARDVMK